MTSADLLAAVVPVAACLDGLGVRHYVTGSAASSAHGIARASMDVDLVAELEPEHVDRLIACLGTAYYVPADALRAAVARRQSFNLIHLATMFKVDVFVSRGRPFDRVAADRASLEPFDDDEEATRLPVATPEDTALAKLEWFRRGGEVSERQWWDVVGVLKVARHADREYLRTWARALGVTDLLERALADADNDA
jgi:hypothetical protein